MYVAVKGGERAIENAHTWLAEERRGDTQVAELSPAQIRQQLGLAVNRVMAEGSLYDPDLAALAIKQARGDLIEAIFLIRAYRTTLPRFGYSQPIDTGEMTCDRRISATFKDLPGGQVLGPTFDYTHRLLDFKLAADGEVPPAPSRSASPEPVPHVTGFLNREGLIEEAPADDTEPPDLTREPLELPADRSLRLQGLTRADEGFTLALGLFQHNVVSAAPIPFAGEIRIGTVSWPSMVFSEELGFSVEIGEIAVTECRNRSTSSRVRRPRCRHSSRSGYGLDLRTDCERKAMAMALVDRCAALAANWARTTVERAGTGRGVRAVAQRQRPSDGFRRAL